MPSFTIPEEIIGIPLFVPAKYESAFEIDANAMPNGADCIVVRGDIEPYARAVQTAPVMNPNICYEGENPASPNDWSMSCWLKLTDLSVAGTDRVMLGCSTGRTTGPFVSGTVNRNIAFLLGVNGTQGAKIHRETITNAASPSSTLNIVGTSASGWARVADRWHLCVMGVSGGTGYLYIDDDPTAIASDTFGGSAASGVLNTPMYLHLGPMGTSAVLGRNEAWRIGKWAFHDHMLTQSERELMYSTMFGLIVITDNFDRAAIGNKWTTVTGFTAFDILSDQARGNGTTDRAMYYNQSIGSPDMYAEVDIVNALASGAHVAVFGRVSPSASTLYMGYYWPSANLWEIYRRVAGTWAGPLVSVNSAMTPPGRMRLEVETISGDVELRLYQKVGASKTLKASYTDTNAARILTNNFAGLRVTGTTGQNQLADNFECGRLTA